MALSRYTNSRYLPGALVAPAYPRSARPGVLPNAAAVSVFPRGPNLNRWGYLQGGGPITVNSQPYSARRGR